MLTHPTPTPRCGGKPEILNRADRRVERCLRHGLPSQSMAALALPVAKNTEVLRGFQDSFQFEPGISFGLLAAIAVSSSFVGRLEDLVDSLANA